MQFLHFLPFSPFILRNKQINSVWSQKLKTPPPHTHTSDNELALVLHSSSLVAGDAGVVAVVGQREVGDAQRAGEVYVVDGDSQAGRDWPAVLLPGDEDRLVPRHDHTWYKDPLANWKAGEFKRVDGRWDCEGDTEVYFLQACTVNNSIKGLTLKKNVAYIWSLLALCWCQNTVWIFSQIQSKPQKNYFISFPHMKLLNWLVKTCTWHFLSVALQGHCSHREKQMLCKLMT